MWGFYDPKGLLVRVARSRPVFLDSLDGQWGAMYDAGYRIRRVAVIPKRP
jgi:hypothetical protein